MKKQMIKALSALIGMPLWDAGRACDLHWFEFGEKRTVTTRKGENKEVGSYALHIQCAWRLCSAERVIVASRDRYYPPTGEKGTIPDDFDWDAMPQNNRFDNLMKLFFDEHTDNLPIVKAVECGSAGYAKIILSNEIALEIFPDDSFGQGNSDNWRSEHWRLFQPYTNNEHFVVAGHGIEIQ